jgi:hypothetical protein
MIARIIFIHRSVGENLLNDSHFYELLERKKVLFSFADCNQNTGCLRSGSNIQKVNLEMPGTDPVNYAELFSEKRRVDYGNGIDVILSYDVIIIKSCYPNSNIKSDADLEAVKGYYSSISKFFNTLPDKRLVIMTSPPLVPYKTNLDVARRARQLADWLSNTNLGSNVRVFNLFNILAESEKSSQENMLRKKFRRVFPFDSHPNKLAAKEIAPKLIVCLQGLFVNQ